MARRSARKSGGSQAISEHTPVNASRKRTHSSSERTTGTKSRFWKDQSKENPDEQSDQSDSSDSNEDSDFGGEPGLESAPESESGSDLDSGDDISDDEKPRRKRRAAPKKASQAAVAKGKQGNELWRQDVRTGLAPGTQVVIKKPKPRAAGKTPYADTTIHPNTFLFLGDLKANNDREWLKMHDADYRTSLKDWDSFVEALTAKLVEIDETVPELPTKDITFRIYRDIRFSKDPTPYKTYFSAAWSRTGRKGPYATYYLQVSPGNSFIGGGLWHPEAPALAALRNDIDRQPQRLKSVLMNDQMRREFLNGVPNKEDKVVKAFTESPTNAESALKTKPKGYDAGHVDIDLLRLKNFTIGRKLTDSEVLDPHGFVHQVTNLFSVMLPFITCLNRIVMPDPGDDSEEEDDEEESSESETEDVEL